MEKSSAAVCYSFLKRVPAQQRNVLLKHLSDDQVSAFSLAPELHEDPLKFLSPLEEEINFIHFSWLAPFLRSLSEGDIKLFLGCLTESQQNGLKTSLLFSNQIPNLSACGKIFLRKQLFASLAGHEDLLPISCLPSSPMNALLTLHFEHLLILI